MNDDGLLFSVTSEPRDHFHLNQLRAHDAAGFFMFEPNNTNLNAKEAFVNDNNRRHTLLPAIVVVEATRRIIRPWTNAPLPLQTQTKQTVREKRTTDTTTSTASSPSESAENAMRSTNAAANFLPEHAGRRFPNPEAADETESERRQSWGRTEFPTALAFSSEASVSVNTPDAQTLSTTSRILLDGQLDGFSSITEKLLEKSTIKTDLHLTNGWLIPYSININRTIYFFIV